MNTIDKIDALLGPAEEKLKIANDEVVKISKQHTEAVKRRNDERKEVDLLKARKTRIIEQTSKTIHNYFY